MTEVVVAKGEEPETRSHTRIRKNGIRNNRNVPLDSESAVTLKPRKQNAYAWCLVPVNTGNFNNQTVLLPLRFRSNVAHQRSTQSKPEERGACTSRFLALFLWREYRHRHCCMICGSRSTAPLPLQRFSVGSKKKKSIEKCKTTAVLAAEPDAKQPRATAPAAGPEKKDDCPFCVYWSPNFVAYIWFWPAILISLCCLTLSVRPG